MKERVVMVSEAVALSAAVTIAAYAPESSQVRELQMHLSSGTPGLTRWSSLDDETLQTVIRSMKDAIGNKEAMRLRSEMLADLRSRNNTIKISV